MTKPIEISNKQYQTLFAQLKKDYPPSVTLLRNKMKDKLGFVPREYKDWDDTIGKHAGGAKIVSC